MKFNKHSGLIGNHAFLSPSQYHWVNYSREKLADRYRTAQAAQLGVRLHAFAAESISLKQKLPRTAQTLNMFVNDSIGFKLSPEVVLYYSDNAFGTADAIGFHKNTLRIFDLKTGVTPASLVQLEVYAALFCLEYKVKPPEIKMILRLYQNDEIIEHIPDYKTIIDIMGKIMEYDKLIDSIKREDQV